jgi:hypothetical protein
MAARSEIGWSRLYSSCMHRCQSNSRTLRKCKSDQIVYCKRLTQWGYGIVILFCKWDKPELILPGLFEHEGHDSCPRGIHWCTSDRDHRMRFILKAFSLQSLQYNVALKWLEDRESFKWTSSQRAMKIIVHVRKRFVVRGIEMMGFVSIYIPNEIFISSQKIHVARYRRMTVICA